ncbi:hypothetical protein HG537_0E02250 [Torulaspora globosa]|uniref:Transcription activator GCR1-like domain-containing protein n=1 Tax=Torulaspora globosa TaxID=48254 RepID=A0A7H9HU38_9SACH|nr:hypothetical protein HG537_0E02250 [Torulaspora sp. CBS 2947]
MDQAEVRLNERVINLERQISMFERMVHMLSSNLDEHLKRYDMILVAQQQQISDLHLVVSTLVNDQNRHAEVLREKLSGALHGISSTAASVNETIHSIPRLNGRTLEPESFFDEILNSGGPAAVKPKVTQPIDHTVSYGHRFNESNDNGRDHENENEAHNGGIGDNSMKQRDPRGPGGHGNDERQFSSSIIPYDDFSPLNNPHSHPRATGPSNNPPGLTDHAVYQNPNTTANPAITMVKNEPHHNGTTEVENGLTEEQYLTITGRKRKRSLFVGNFQFMKSPHSVVEVWKEYTEGINGQPSIKEMELIYQTGWRRDPAVNKRYSRRKVLCKAIETGLAKGYALDYTVNLLEDYRFIDREKGLKQPIGWLCQGQNIPDELRGN